MEATTVFAESVGMGISPAFGIADRSCPGGLRWLNGVAPRLDTVELG